MNTPRRPIVIESDALPPLPDGHDLPDPFAPTGQAMQTVTTLAAGRRAGWFRRMVWGAAGGLAALLIGMFIYDSLLVMIAGYPVIAAIAIALTLIVVLVAATDFPTNPWIVYAAVGLFLAVRLLDEWVAGRVASFRR